MPRFFLHLKSGDALIEDIEGSELPNPEAARKQALWGAREMLADTIRGGDDLRVEAFVIVDEQGRQLVSVPVTEVLPPRIRKLIRP